MRIQGRCPSIAERIGCALRIFGAARSNLDADARRWFHFQNAIAGNDRSFDIDPDRVFPLSIGRDNHIVIWQTGFDLIRRRGYSGAAFTSVLITLQRQ
jgi:hypothetical protein